MTGTQNALGSRLKAEGKSLEPRAWSLQPNRAFTLVELMIVAAILVVAIVALLAAFLGQLTLNEHARNLTWAVNDANRVMERLRQQNTGAGCGPTAAVQGAECGGCTSWDDWLAANGGKSMEPGGTPALSRERICVYPSGGPDPLQIDISVCWRHRNRTIGGCDWDGTTLTFCPGAAQGPAMLSTLMTCRE